MEFRLSNYFRFWADLRERLEYPGVLEADEAPSFLVHSNRRAALIERTGY